MVDHIVKNPIDILCDVLVKVESFIFLDNFIILDFEADFDIPMVL